MSGTDKRKSAQRLVLAGVAAFAATASLLMTGDELLHAQFDDAFENRIVAAASRQGTPSTTRQPVAASEDFWLGDARRAPVTPAAWNQETHVGIGDRVTLTLRGHDQNFEVVAVEAFPMPAVWSEGSATSVDKEPMLVTLRPIGGSTGAIHLLLDRNSDLGPLAQLSERAQEL